MGMLTNAKTTAPIIGGAIASLYPEDAEAGWVKRLIDGVEKETFNMWHGGGDFGESTKFNPNLAGSGEGNAAYSFGLYGADVENVSRGYGKGFARRKQLDAKNADEMFMSIFQKDYGEYGDSGYTIFSFDAAKEAASEYKNVFGGSSKEFSERIKILEDAKNNNNMNDSLIDIFINSFDYNKNFDVNANTAIDGYARIIADVGSEYSYKTYLEPQYLPEENFYEPPAADNLAEAAKMAADARKRDGISNEFYATMNSIYKGGKGSESSREKIIDILRSAFETKSSEKGWLYNIDIPQIKKENVLMWDYPINKQPKIQEKLKAVANRIKEMPKEYWSDYEFNAYEKLQDILSGKEFNQDDLKELQKYVRVSAKETEGAKRMDDIGAGSVVWLLERILPQRQVAELMSEEGIQASSHLNRASRKDVRTVPFHKRDISMAQEHGDFNHVIYDKVDLSFLTKEQVGNASPELLAAIVGSGGVVSAVSQVEKETLSNKAKAMFSDFIDNTVGAFGSAFEGLEVPQRGLQGVARAGYGMLTGESLDEALNQGANVIHQGTDKTAKKFGDFIFDKTGSPSAATAGVVAGKFLSPI